MAGTAIIQNMGSTVRPSARCRRGKAQRAAERPAHFRRNGFLKHSFRSVWAYGADPKFAERQFAASLQNLNSYYGLTVGMSALAFPQNIYSTWHNVGRALQAIDKGLHCFIIGDEKHQSVLATAKPMDVAGLYYIPVKAFWLMSVSGENTAETDIILRLFAYLNQKAGLPFYQESGSFMDEQYETLENWLSEAEAEEDGEEQNWFSAQLDALYEIRRAGGHLLPLIQNPVLLKDFRKVCARNIPKVDEELAAIAQQFLQLYADYPKGSLYDHIHTELIYPHEEETIRADQYTGFFWSAYDPFADELDSLVTSQFQEIAVMEEPADLKIFDSLPATEQIPVLDYENRLLLLIQDLRDYLNRCEYEKYNGTV